MWRKFMRNFVRMTILISTVLILLTGCAKEKVSGDEVTNNYANNEKKQLYVTNYAIEKQLSEVVVLDEDLNLLNKLEPNGGIYIYSNDNEKTVYSYGSDSTIAKINIKDENIDNVDFNEGVIKKIEYVNDVLWGIDNGYFYEEDIYKFNIINLDDNVKYTYEGYPLSYSHKDNYIYVLINNINKSFIELLKFNTDDGSVEEFKLKDIEDEFKNIDLKMLGLENYILLIDSLNFDLYKIEYENPQTLKYNGNLSDYKIYIDSNNKMPTQVYDFTVQLDDENILIGVNDGENVKLLRVNIIDNEFTEILPGEGNNYTYVSKPSVDGDYIYISFVKAGEANTISKYNWKTGKLIKKTTLGDYFNKHKQIGNITMYKGE